MMPDVSIIAMSLVRAAGYREAALAAGADDLVLKAALVTDLLPAIRRAVQNGRLGESR
jgi:DNA-binding NarL/FixJ family response regulator